MDPGLRALSPDAPSVRAARRGAAERGSGAAERRVTGPGTLQRGSALWKQHTQTIKAPYLLQAEHTLMLSVQECDFWGTSGLFLLLLLRFTWKCWTLYSTTFINSCSHSKFLLFYIQNKPKESSTTNKTMWKHSTGCRSDLCHTSFLSSAHADNKPSWHTDGKVFM